MERSQKPILRFYDVGLRRTLKGTSKGASGGEEWTGARSSLISMFKCSGGGGRVRRVRRVRRGEEGFSSC